MAKPSLTVTVRSIGGSELTLAVAPGDNPEQQIRGEVAKSGVPENQQIFMHQSAVLFDDTQFEDGELTLGVLLSQLGGDVANLSLSVVTRDPIVTEWLEKVQSWSCTSLGEAPAIVCNSEEVLLSAARRGFIDDVFGYAGPELLADKTFMLKAVRLSGECIRYAADALKTDRDMVIEAVRKDGRKLQFAPEDLKADAEIVLEAVKEYGGSMEYAAPSLKSDRAFVTKAVEAGGNALGYVDQALVTRDLAMKAVKSDGSAFGWAFDFYSDREIALEAVQKYGEALDFASDELKADKEIVGAAVQNDGRAIEYAADVLKNDKNFIWSCVQANPTMLNCVGAVITEDDQLMREFAAGVAVNGKWTKKLQGGIYTYLEFASSALRSDKEYVLEALKHSYFAIEFVSEDLKEDRDVWLECLNDGDGGCCWSRCPESLKEDWEFAVECCRLPNRSLDEFPYFPQDELEAEVSKRGGPGSRGSDDRCFSH